LLRGNATWHLPTICEKLATTFRRQPVAKPFTFGCP
jgi:hypothetical protein